MTIWHTLSTFELKKKMKTISGKASEALSCGVSNEGMGYYIIDTLVLFIIKGMQSTNF